MEYSRLYLLEGVPLNMNHEHTIDFANAESQFNFFQSYKNTIIDDDDYSWIRDNIIKVNVNIDDIKSCNYIMFNNKSKWYYAFITSKEYVNQNNTQINFVIDVMQTFMFDYTIGETFVEREHQDRYYYENNKLHPIFSRTRENLERGEEFIVKNKTEINDNTPSNIVEVLSNDEMKSLTWATVITKAGIGKKYWRSGVISGTDITESTTTKILTINNNIYAYVIPFIKDFRSYIGTRPSFYVKDNETATSEVKCFTEAEIKELVQNPNIISINISKYAPFNWDCTKNGSRYTIFPLNNITNSAGINLSCYNSTNDGESAGMFFIDNITNLHGNNYHIPQFVIDNNHDIDADSLSIENQYNNEFETKLLTKDYQYNEVIYGDQKLQINNEDLTDNNILIEYLNTYSAKGSSCFILNNYQNQVRNYDNSIYINSVTHELPLLTNAWLSYLQNNKTSLISGLTTNALTTLGGIGLGLMTGGIGLAVAGSTALNYGVQVANQMAQIHDLKQKPNEVKNTTFDLTLDWCTKGIGLQMYKYSIRNEFLQKIGKYFHHYGYLANEFITPNLKSRYYFNYIKTIGCNIQSSIDNEYVSELRNIFDNGVTIWHYRDDSTWKGVGEYNYENVETSILEVTSND